MVGQLCELQICGDLQILQQSLLLPDLPADPFFHLLYTALHLLRFGSDVAARSIPPVMLLDGIVADLGALILICPSGGPGRGLPKLSDLLQVLFVFRCGKLVLSGLIFPPDRKAPVHHLNGLPVQHQAVIRTGVQKLSVVGHQDKAFF